MATASIFLLPGSVHCDNCYIIVRDEWGNCLYRQLQLWAGRAAGSADARRRCAYCRSLHRSIAQLTVRTALSEARRAQKRCTVFVGHSVSQPHQLAVWLRQAMERLQARRAALVRAAIEAVRRAAARKQPIVARVLQLCCDAIEYQQ